MLIILHGEDTLRSRQKLKKLEASYKQKHEGGFSFEKLYADEINMQEFRNSARAGSLFDSHKLVVLEGLSANTSLKSEIGDWDGLSDIAKNKDILVIFYEPSSVAKDKGYKKILSAASKKQEFKALSSAEASSWFFKHFSQRNIKISQQIIKKVVDLYTRTENKQKKIDMHSVYNELLKLYTYRGGKEIKAEDLDTLNIGDSEAQIFPTIDAIFEGKKDKAIHSLLLHWQEGAAPEYIFYMIERQLKITAQVIDESEKKTPQSSIAKKIGQHPFVVKKTFKLAGRFSQGKIKNLYSRVEGLDVKTKTGRLDPRLSVELLSAAILA